MARRLNLQPLALSAGADSGAIDTQRSSMKSPKSPKSPFLPRFSNKKSPAEPYMQSAATDPQPQRLNHSQTLPSISSQHYADSAAGQPIFQDDQVPRAGFFSKPSKAATTLSSGRQPAAAVSPIRLESEGSMSSHRYTDHPAEAGNVSGRGEPNNDRSATRNPNAGPSTSVASLAVHTDASSSQADSRGTSKKSKPKSFHGILSRSRSTRDERSPDVDKFNQKQEPDRHLGQREPARPAPNQGDPRDTMGSNQRQHSEDRHLTSRDLTKENGKAAPSFSSSLRDGGSGGHSFLSNLKSSATKGAGAIQKGLFGKGGRSATPEKDGPLGDEHYVLKTLNLPLVEQTRLTRISKKLEDSRDKTEFWMPAFPWRAIDYLNYKGSDVEGLYRVPGSSVEIKKWQRKFDELLDIDLFEQPDLYDINIIGSMLKAWLRDLPDELFPKDAQDRVARSCAGQGLVPGQDKDPSPEKVPQVLVDELSKLSPFRYYLLFAVTCHLSLLLAHKSKNMMDFRNLCICFQPCLKIDAYSFKFLVCDWRDCWKGCHTESTYIDEEYRLFALHDESVKNADGNGEGRSSTAVDSPEERNISSADSSKPSSVSADHQSQKTAKPDKSTKNGLQKNIEAQKKAQTTQALHDKAQAEKKANAENKALREKKAQADKTAAKAQKAAQDRGQRNDGLAHTSSNSSTGNVRTLTLNPAHGNSAAVSKVSLADARTGLTVQGTSTPPRTSADMRPLSPIKPLSPSTSVQQRLSTNFFMSTPM